MTIVRVLVLMLCLALATSCVGPRTDEGAVNLEEAPRPHPILHGIFELMKGLLPTLTNESPYAPRHLGVPAPYPYSSRKRD